jgi:hypothetical protein
LNKTKKGACCPEQVANSLSHHHWRTMYGYYIIHIFHFKGGYTMDNIDQYIITGLVNIEFVTVAMKNLGYDDASIKALIEEADRLLYEEEPKKISKKALKIGKRSFGELEWKIHKLRADYRFFGGENSAFL